MQLFSLSHGPGRQMHGGWMDVGRLAGGLGGTLVLAVWDLENRVMNRTGGWEGGWVGGVGG